MVTVSYELLVCRCCAVKLGTDEGCDCPPESHPSGVATFVGIPDNVHLVNGDSDGDTNFMHVPCAGCDTRDAGDREPVIGLTD